MGYIWFSACFSKLWLKDQSNILCVWYMGRMHMCTHECRCMVPCEHVWKQRMMTSVLFYHSPLYSLDTGRVSQTLSSPFWLGWWASKQAPRICWSLPFNIVVIDNVLLHQAFYIGARDSNCGPHACTRKPYHLPYPSLIFLRLFKHRYACMNTHTHT